MLERAGSEKGQLTRGDLKAALMTLTGSDRRLADLFFRYVREEAAAKVTTADIRKAVQQAKAQLTARYRLDPSAAPTEAELQALKKLNQKAGALAKALRRLSGD